MINKFAGRYGFLSNFWPSPIVWDSREWPTAEHLYQARKTRVLTFQEKIRRASTPGKAKQLGRNIPLRSDWEQVKFEIMLDCVKLKFSNPELEAMLVGTYPKDLVEGNYWHDNEWGDCSCEKCSGIQGRNMLGQALLLIREKAICKSK